MTFQGCRNGAALQISRVPMVTINASNFINNGRLYHSTGRAIHVSRSNIIINKSFFNNNIAHYDQGGAIYAQYSNVTIENSELSNNYASYSGGAIYMNQNENRNFALLIHAAVLYENRCGGSGGATSIYSK